MHFIRHLFDWIIKLFQYGKLLWSDFDFDYSYALILLKFKLERMAKSIEKNKIHIGYEKNVKQMRTCIALIDRLLEDSYISEEYSAALGRWDFLGEGEEIHGKDGTVIAHAAPDMDPEDEKICRRESKKTEARIQQDWDYLFKMLHKNMRNWWD